VYYTSKLISFEPISFFIFQSNERYIRAKILNRLTRTKRVPRYMDMFVEIQKVLVFISLPNLRTNICCNIFFIAHLSQTYVTLLYNLTLEPIKCFLFVPSMIRIKKSTNYHYLGKYFLWHCAFLKENLGIALKRKNKEELYFCEVKTKNVTNI